MFLYRALAWPHLEYHVQFWLPYLNENVVEQKGVTKVFGTPSLLRKPKDPAAFWITLVGGGTEVGGADLVCL